MRARPVLRYFGGKWRIAPWIIGHLPEHRIYVEPYGGAASVLLRKARSYVEIYNDLDGELVNFFRVLRDPEQAGRLLQLLQLTPHARKEFELSFQDCQDPIEQARRTAVRCMMGFGCSMVQDKPYGWRTFSHRRGTTAAMDWGSYPAAIAPMVERLRGVVIENMPALELIKKYDGPGVLFYLDPPYVGDSRQVKRGYRHEMSDQEHRDLAELLGRVQGRVVLSGYACRLYDELYGSWRRVERVSLADGGKRRKEVLWLR